MEKKEIIRDILLILCVFVLFVIPWTSVFGVENEAVLEAIGLAQRYMGTFLVFILVLRLIYKTYGKSLHQEMMEEEIKEAHQEDSRQSLFKPTIGVLIFFVLFTVAVMG